MFMTRKNHSWLGFRFTSVQSCIRISVVVMMLVCPGLASAAHPPHHPASLQIFHPIATSSDPETSTNVRLSLLFGRSGHIHGFDASAVASVTGGDFTGLQLTGLYSRIEGSFEGVSFNFGVQNHLAPATGIQFAGLANFHQDFFAGAQLAGSLNYTRKGFVGAQFSGLMNLNDGYGGYLQVSSVANVNVKAFGGVQIAAIMNFAGEETFGTQIAVLNYAGQMEGAQIGLVNMSEEMSGLQIGVVNISHRFEGLPVGVVNITDDSKLQGLAYGSNLSLYNVGARTVVNKWSSILSLGYSDQSSYAVNAGFIGWHFGRQFSVGEKAALTLDAGYLHIIPKDYDDPAINDNPHFAMQMRLFAYYGLGKTVALVAGGGFSTIFSEYTTHARSQTEGHVFGGISLF